MGGGRDEQPAPHSERAQCGGWSRAKVQTAEGGRFLAITRPNVQMKQKVQTISVIQLFAFADAIDCLLLFIGTVGAVIHGCGLPIYFLFFGKLLDGFGANASNPSKMIEIINQVAFTGWCMNPR